jgi:phage terminase large subunit-like protein
MVSEDLIRQTAEHSLEAFIRLVHPGAVLGAIHSEVCQWITRSNKRSHQLLLLPRDHQKSRLAAYFAAWKITKNPAIRILYVSSTSTLAVKQVKFIKDILTSPIYKRYWPDMVNDDIGQREKWTETEFSVDHPKRKQENIRDSTVFAAGLTTNTTGLHCDLAILDDLVTPENAYTNIGREAVSMAYSYLASIEGADAEELVVGTRYHPKDIYGEMMERMIEYNGKSEPLYEVFMRAVEDRGDGYGNFLWPRTTRPDGVSFGFTPEILAKKKAQYSNKTHFRAQYYNDPNDAENSPISRDLFQYYDPRHLTRADGCWFFKSRRLNVFAAVDFAFSLSKDADYTSIIVVGVDGDGYILVLDMVRFKTKRIADYFQHILDLHNKWGFRKLRAEVSVAQATIVEELKSAYIRPYGLMLTIDEYRPDRREGTKEERINAALRPKYEARRIYHPLGHNLVQVLEEELILENPPHDDLKDVLASVMDILAQPAPPTVSGVTRKSQLAVHPRFGGISLGR